MAVLHSAAYIASIENHAGVEMADNKTIADWQKLATKERKGAGPDDLLWQTPN